MGAWRDILNAFSADPQVIEVLVVPNAPPMSRTAEGWHVLMGTIFSVTSIAEMLEEARRPKTIGPGVSVLVGAERLGMSGVFAVSVPDVGRFRVSYLSQRGSRALRIERIPVTPPSLSSVCEHADVCSRLTAALLSPEKPCAVLIYGLSPAANNTVVYALLNDINKTQRKVIYVIERRLSFLMAHDSSAVIQAEVGSDVETLDKGIQNAFLVEPDLVYVGDVRPADVGASLSHLLNTRCGVILSTVAGDARPFVQRVEQAIGEAHFGVRSGIDMTVKVLPRPGRHAEVTIDERAAP